MASSNKFISKENVQLIWEFITDEGIIAASSDFEIIQLKKYYINEMSNFYEKNKNNQQDLLELNKQFIGQLVKTFKEPKLEYEKKKKVQYKEVKDVNEAITFKEIQNEKKISFDSELSMKQNEFQSMIAKPLPESIDFQDNYKDKPITEMEKLIAQTIAERNFELEKIHKDNMKVSKESIKSAPVTKTTALAKQPQQPQQPQESGIKYIKIGNDDLNVDVNPIILNQSQNPLILQITEIEAESEPDDPNNTTIFQLIKEIRVLNDKIDKITNILERDRENHT
jgi:hypothetical protein